MPAASDRAIIRVDANCIVESVRNDEKMPLPFDVQPVHGAGQLFLRADIEELAFRFAQEITLLADQLDFISEGVRRLLSAQAKAVSLSDDNLTLLAEVWNAAREHKVPDWWPAAREERNARSKHG